MKSPNVSAVFLPLVVMVISLFLARGGPNQAGLCNLLIQGLLQLSSGALARREDRKNHANCMNNSNLKVHYAHLTRPEPSLEILRPVRIFQTWLNRNSPGDW